MSNYINIVMGTQGKSGSFAYAHLILAGGSRRELEGAISSAASTPNSLAAKALRGVSPRNARKKSGRSFPINAHCSDIILEWKSKC